MPRLSIQERQHAIRLMHNGVHIKAIGRALNCHHSSVKRLLQKYRQTGSVKNLPRSAPPRVAASKRRPKVTARPKKRSSGGEMASASVLQKLTQRAKMAEGVITHLKSQIETVQAAAALSVSRPEEDRLRLENTALRAQIESLKSKLILAEIKNGVKQIQLPAKKPKIAAPEGGVTVEVKTQPEKQSDKPNKQQKGGDAKAKKESAGDEAVAKKPAAAKGNKKANDGAGAEPVDISRLDMRVGKIVEVQKHPDADTLYVETVDLGESQPRTIVSGLVKHVPIEQMHGRLALFMCNLKPAKMRGIMSQGMIMCTNSPEKVEILEPPAGSQIGDRVFAEGYTNEPDALLNPKKKVWETIKPDLRTDGDRVAAYKGARLSIKDRGLVTSPTQSNAQIS